MCPFPPGMQTRLMSRTLSTLKQRHSVVMWMRGWPRALLDFSFCGLAADRLLRAHRKLGPGHGERALSVRRQPAIGSADAPNGFNRSPDLRFCPSLLIQGLPGNEVEVSTMGKRFRRASHRCTTGQGFDALDLEKRGRLCHRVIGG